MCGVSFFTALYYGPREGGELHAVIKAAWLRTGRAHTRLNLMALRNLRGAFSFQGDCYGHSNSYQRRGHGQSWMDAC